MVASININIHFKKRWYEEYILEILARISCESAERLFKIGKSEKSISRANEIRASSTETQYWIKRKGVKGDKSHFNLGQTLKLYKLFASERRNGKRERYRSFPGCFRVFVRLKYVPSRTEPAQGRSCREREGNEDERRSRAE